MKGSAIHDLPPLDQFTHKVFDPRRLSTLDEIALLRDIMNKTLGCHARVQDVVLDAIVQYARPRLFEGHTYCISPKQTPIVVTLKPHHTTFILDELGNITLALRN
jgi:hypothetical protein